CRSALARCPDGVVLNVPADGWLDYASTVAPLLPVLRLRGDPQGENLPLDQGLEFGSRPDGEAVEAGGEQRRDRDAELIGAGLTRKSRSALPVGKGVVDQTASSLIGDDQGEIQRPDLFSRRAADPNRHRLPAAGGVATPARP